MIRVRKMATRFLGSACAVLFSLMSVSASRAADFVFICTPTGSVLELERLKAAADFYGLNLIVAAVNSPGDSSAIERLVRREDTVGVAMAADALGKVNRKTVLRSLGRLRRSNIPLFIAGVAPDMAPMVLETWSGGAIAGSRRLQNTAHPEYVFGQLDRFTLQLANLAIPSARQDAAFFVLSENARVQSLLSVRDDHRDFPLFIETMVRQQEVFVSSMTPSIEKPAAEEVTLNAFLAVAPEMMFVKYCAGERGWHVLHHYANFTIDDPWLRQPYGYVDYQGLLREMQKHDFHTTIAFIPWNYGRSDRDVVTLFRDHPDRFSIVIHGNNHDHKEFTDYRSKPLDAQIAGLKQALARMERFAALTGVPYDKVMVFPHSIAPEGTLRALKTYNYLATVNSSSVPQGAEKPTDALFDLRSFTLSFAGFPSLSRYPVAVPLASGYIAITAFLDNPLLFYAHSDFFGSGITAFDAVADGVNKVEPNIQWRSLGDIVRHLYRVKLRDDCNYDVLAFSNSVTVENTSDRDSVFYLRKLEAGPQAVRSAVVDGQPYPYDLQNGYLTLNIAIPKNASRVVNIEYENDLELASVDASPDSYAVWALRWSSDFRDIYLAKSKIGLAIIRIYNNHNLKPWQALGALFVLLTSFAYLWHRRRLLVSSRGRALSEAGKYIAISPSAVPHLKSTASGTSGPSNH